MAERGTRTRSLGVLMAAAVLQMTPCCRDQESQTRRFQLSGEVVSVDPAARRATIAHDDIPGFMGAMTMPFEVKDAGALETLAPGDRVQATLVVVEESSWLEELVITRNTRQGEPVEAVSSLTPLPAAGQMVPDFTLVNQDGQPVHLHQYHGRVVVLTFIYTRCPLPEYCPRMTSHFAELEKNLRTKPELHRQTHLLSISIDPGHDSPEVLRDYARKQVSDQPDSFNHWELATGSEEDIQKIAAFFGLTYFPERDQIVHSLRTAVIDPEGKLFKLYPGNEWTPSDIMNDIASLEIEDSRF